MIFIRPAKSSDLADLLKLSAQTGYGLTTLPNDPNILRSRRSVSGFTKCRAAGR
jgi:arginine/ornithine N-succinyltransferase beta subunit